MTPQSQRPRAALTRAAGAVVLLVAITACGSLPADGQHPATDQTTHIQPAASTGSPTTITIDPSIGETFTPTANGSPALTASQAYADFAQLNNWASTAIPDYITAQLGLLTYPAGPADAPGMSHYTISNGEAYKALNELTWAFSWKECPPPLVPSPAPGASPAPAPTPSNCVAWIFLDANTGKQIDQTWQTQ